MTPQQAASHLAAKRTDAPTPYALGTITAGFALDHHMPGELAQHVAAAHITHGDRVELTALLRSAEDPVMPPHVERAITNALKEIQP